MRLKEIRNSKKLSCAKLSVLSGVPQRTIEKIELRKQCTVANAIKLANALDVTLDELCR